MVQSVKSIKGVERKKTTKTPQHSKVKKHPNKKSKSHTPIRPHLQPNVTKGASYKKQKPSQKQHTPSAHLQADSSSSVDLFDEYKNGNEEEEEQHEEVNLNISCEDDTEDNEEDMEEKFSQEASDSGKEISEEDNSETCEKEEEGHVSFSGDLSAVKDRIAENAQRLANWREESQRHKGLSRATIVEQLTQDAALYYGFSLELAEYFMKLFNPVECIAFFESVEVPRPLTLRTNMLLTRRRDLAKVLISRGCNVDPVGDWTKVGLKVLESSVPVGATPEYCAGHYMIQAASSFIPVMALAPQPGELILDMAASPGGKSTYIGQLMKNSGVLFCNEYNKERLAPLVANLHRMGITNSIVLNEDGAELPENLPPVDRVLLDAPCTGSGLLSRDPSVKTKRSLADFMEQATLQKKLLAAAVDVCNATSATGGYIVYSTCSLSVEENEEVIDYILKARHVKVVPFGFPDDMWSCGLSRYQHKRFHPSLKYARRIYPHLHNMDGFFVCKLKKLSNAIPKREKKDRRKSNIYVKTWTKEDWTPDLLNNVTEQVS